MALTVPKVQIIVVAGSRVFQVRHDDAEAPSRLQLSVSNDSGREWTSVEPGWRPLSYGLSGECFYVWSARRVIAFGDRSGQPDVLDSDEDIHVVFRLEAGWLLVCETSVRLVESGRETARIELPESVTEARMENTSLIVSHPGGREVRVIVAADGLAIA